MNQNNLTFPMLNNMTICMDCHFNSIRHFTFIHVDTTCFDRASGLQIYQHTDQDSMVLTSYRGWRPLPGFPVDTTQGNVLA